MHHFILFHLLMTRVTSVVCQSTDSAKNNKNSDQLRVDAESRTS